LGISWKDKVTNVEVRAKTGHQSMENTLREIRLRCLGHVFRVDHRCIPHKALYREVQERTRANWRGAVKNDLQKMTLTWEEAEVAALTDEKWRQSVAQCVHFDAG